MQKQFVKSCGSWPVLRMGQSPVEKTYVEIPFIEQLRGMRWEHIEGDMDVP